MTRSGRRRVSAATRRVASRPPSLVEALEEVERREGMAREGDGVGRAGRDGASGYGVGRAGRDRGAGDGVGRAGRDGASGYGVGRAGRDGVAGDGVAGDGVGARSRARWLLASGAAQILIPHATVDLARRDARVILEDATAAAALLERVPSAQLDRPVIGSGPSTREVLTAVVEHPGRVCLRGYVGWQEGWEHVSLNVIRIEDPELFRLEPDVVLGALPEAASALEPKQRDRYLRDRALCVTSSVVRQQWFMVRARYGLRSATTPPLRPDLEWQEALGSGSGGGLALDVPEVGVPEFGVPGVGATEVGATEPGAQGVAAFDGALAELIGFGQAVEMRWR